MVIPVQFEVDGDADAARVHAALTTLGLKPTRRGPRDRAFEVVGKQVDRCIERYGLSAALAVALQQVLMGVDSAAQLAVNLEISSGAARARVLRLCRAMGCTDLPGVVAKARLTLG